MLLKSNIFSIREKMYTLLLRGRKKRLEAANGRVSLPGLGRAFCSGNIVVRTCSAGNKGSLATCVWPGRTGWEPSGRSEPRGRQSADGLDSWVNGKDQLRR